MRFYRFIKISDDQVCLDFDNNSAACFTVKIYADMYESMLLKYEKYFNKKEAFYISITVQV